MVKYGGNGITFLCLDRHLFTPKTIHMTNYRDFNGMDISFKDMERPKPPVSVGDHFKFNYCNCVVVALGENRFQYEYVNPSFKNERIKRWITYIYWQKNVFYDFNTPILKGDKCPAKIKDEFHLRELKRLKTKLFILSLK